MVCRESFKDPGAAPEERRQKMKELLQPAVDDILSHAEEEKDAVFYFRGNADGHYLENLSGLRKPVPDWAKSCYGL